MTQALEPAAAAGSTTAGCGAGAGSSRHGGLHDPGPAAASTEAGSNKTWFGPRRGRAALATDRIGRSRSGLAGPVTPARLTQCGCPGLHWHGSLHPIGLAETDRRPTGPAVRRGAVGGWGPSRRRAPSARCTCSGTYGTQDESEETSSLDTSARCTCSVAGAYRTHMARGVKDQHL